MSYEVTTSNKFLITKRRNDPNKSIFRCIVELLGERVILRRLPISSLRTKVLEKCKQRQPGSSTIFEKLIGIEGYI